MVLRLPTLEEATSQAGQLGPGEAACRLSEASGWRRLRVAYHYAARHQALERELIIRRVLAQALERGPDYVLARASPEAGIFMEWAGQVRHELCRAVGFIRLIPSRDGKLLVGRWELRHQIADLVLRHFQRRYPGHQVIILAGGRAYSWGRRGLVVEEAARYEKHLAQRRAGMRSEAPGCQGKAAPAPEGEQLGLNM